MSLSGIPNNNCSALCCHAILDSLPFYFPFLGNYHYITASRA